MRIKLLVFSLLPGLILFGAAEGVLRLAGFRYSDTPLEIQSFPEKVAETRQRAVKKGFKKDKYQHWVPQDSFEDDYAREKPAGTVRIAALGCSCTQSCAFTDESYPSLMEAKLNEQFETRYEVLNAGVGSYSSYQGLQRLKHAVLPYAPDILTIFFGWNDHWVSSMPDKEIRIKSDFEINAVNFFEKFRVYQALHFLIAKGLQGAKRNGKEKPEVTLRVEPKDYEANLKQIIALAREHGIQPVLITAPYQANLLKPFWNFPTSDIQELIFIHEAYNGVVRKVAEDENVPLVELSGILQEFLARDDTPVFTDGVHYTPMGCNLVATFIASELKRQGLLS